MATTDTQLQQLVINVGTDAQIQGGIGSGTITDDMLSIATDGSDIVYDWVGTLAEYTTQNIATNHPDWLCFITDDVNSSAEDIYNNVYSKTQSDETFVAKVDNVPYLPNLLEYKYTDHILNNISWLRADTFSWQSSKIYEGVYNHLTDDMAGATQKSAYLKHNVALVGDATVSNRGILSGFRANVSYAIASGVRTPTTSFELVVKVKVPETISNSTIVYSYNTCYHGTVIRFTSATNIKVWVSSNNSSWNVLNGTDFTASLPLGNWCWLRFSWNGSAYTLAMSNDGLNYTSLGAVSSTAAINWSDGKFNLGACNWESYPGLGASIDLNQCYVKIDGGYVWKGTDYMYYYEAADGHKIVLADQENNVDYLYNKGDGWYYILDTANQKFKLPRNKRRRVVESGVERGVWYRLYDDGWVEQGGDFKTFTTSWTSTYVGLAVEMASNDYYASPVTGNNDHTDAPSIFEKRTTYFRCVPYDYDYQGRWYVCGQSVVKPRTKAGEDYLYFYVGDFTTDAIVNIAGMATEALNNKAEKGHEVIAFQAPTSSNNYTWYRKYADGWVEQGGKITVGENPPTTTHIMALPITMADTNYNVMIEGTTGDTTNNALGVQYGHSYYGAIWNTGKTTMSFSYRGSIGGCWEVKGMAA